MCVFFNCFNNITQNNNVSMPTQNDSFYTFSVIFHGKDAADAKVMAIFVINDLK